MDLKCCQAPVETTQTWARVLNRQRYRPDAPRFMHVRKRPLRRRFCEERALSSFSPCSPVTKSPSSRRTDRTYSLRTYRMADRKWKETKQQPSRLPGPAVPGCSLVSFHFLWAILCPQDIQYMCGMIGAIGAVHVAPIHGPLMRAKAKRGIYERRTGSGRRDEAESRRRLRRPPSL